MNGATDGITTCGVTLGGDGHVSVTRNGTTLTSATSTLGLFDDSSSDGFEFQLTLTNTTSFQDLNLLGFHTNGRLEIAGAQWSEDVDGGAASLWGCSFAFDP